jgi:hypothetical protein
MSAREFAGVSILTRKSTAPLLSNVEPLNGDVKATYNAIIPVTVIGAYAPQDGRPKEDK